MRFLLFTLSLLALPAHAEEPSRCGRIEAEFQVVGRLIPQACEEAKETHERYQRASAEVIDTCRRLEAQAENPPKLKSIGEAERQLEAIQHRQQGIEERAKIQERITRELLQTPIDTDPPVFPPVQVSEACRNELDEYAKARRQVLSTFSRFFQKIEAGHENLLLPVAVPTESGR